MILLPEISSIKATLKKGDVQEALDQAERLVKVDFPLLADGVILLQSRLAELELQNVKGVISGEAFALRRNKLVDDLLYLLTQLPNDEELSNNGPKTGKLCHNIPTELPLLLATKCVVKIAEKAAYLNLQPGDEVEISDLEISEVMEVELASLGNDAFEIKSFTDRDQYLSSGRATSWVFYVKPLKPGEYVLNLTVKTIQFIDGKERRRNEVLERRIMVSTNSAQAVDPAWQTTNIAVGEAKQKRTKSGGFFSFFKKRSAAAVLLLVFASTMSAGVVAYQFSPDFRGAISKLFSNADPITDGDAVTGGGDELPPATEGSDEGEGDVAEVEGKQDEVAEPTAVIVDEPEQAAPPPVTEPTEDTDTSDGEKRLNQVAKYQGEAGEILDGQQPVAAPETYAAPATAPEKAPEPEENALETVTEAPTDEEGTDKTEAVPDKKDFEILSNLKLAGNSRLDQDVVLHVKLTGFAARNMEVYVDGRPVPASIRNDRELLIKLRRFGEEDYNRTVIIYDRDSGKKIEQPIKMVANYIWTIKKVFD